MSNRDADRLGLEAALQPRGRAVLLAVGLLAIGRERRRRRAPAPAPPAAPSPRPAEPDRPHTVSGVQEPPRWRSRYAFYAVGAGMMAWGLRGLLTTASTKPPNWGRFFVGGVIVHDLVFAPVFALVAVLLVGHIPAAYRSYVQAGVVITALLTLVSLPMVLHPGGRPDDPSTLPLPYGRNLAIALACIWAAVLVTAVVDRRRRSDGKALSRGPSSSSAASTS